jgi:hypothetical protein
MWLGGAWPLQGMTQRSAQKDTERTACCIVTRASLARSGSASRLRTRLAPCARYPWIRRGGSSGSRTGDGSSHHSYRTPPNHALRAGRQLALAALPVAAAPETDLGIDQELVGQRAATELHALQAVQRAATEAHEDQLRRNLRHGFSHGSAPGAAVNRLVRTTSAHRPTRLSDSGFLIRHSSSYCSPLFVLIGPHLGSVVVTASTPVPDGCT